VETDRPDTGMCARTAHAQHLLLDVVAVNESRSLMMIMIRVGCDVLYSCATCISLVYASPRSRRSSLLRSAATTPTSMVIEQWAHSHYSTAPSWLTRTHPNRKCTSIHVMNELRVRHTMLLDDVAPIPCNISPCMLTASRTHRMWITLGTAKVIADRVPEPARRHVYNLDRPVRAGAIRVLLSAAETSIDELEAYSLPVFS